MSMSLKLCTYAEEPAVRGERLRAALSCLGLAALVGLPGCGKAWHNKSSTPRRQDSVAGASTKHLILHELASSSLDGEDYYQLQLTPDEQLLGINSQTHALGSPFTLRGHRALWDAFNAHGEIIAFHVDADASVWALALAPSNDHPLLVLRGKLGSEETLSREPLPAPDQVPISDGRRTWVEQRALGFELNTLASKAQIMPLSATRALILVWYGLLPVLWEVDLFPNTDHSNSAFASSVPPASRYQFLLPLPDPSGGLPLPFIIPEASLVKSAGSLWLAVKPGAGYAPFLDGFIPGTPRGRTSNSTYLARYHAQSLHWQKETIPAAAQLLVAGPAATLTSVSWQDGILSADGQQGGVHCETASSDFPMQTAVHSGLYDGSYLWLGGETNLRQAASGSILAGSQGFVLRWDLTQCTYAKVVWGESRRNYGGAMFATGEGRLALTYQDAPLTHDHDRQAELVLTTIAED